LKKTINKEINRKIAIISGKGNLPRLLSEELLTKKIEHTVVYFSKLTPEWVSSEVNVIYGKIEQIGAIFKELKSNNYNEIVFAGASERSKLDLEIADKTFLELVPDIQRAMKAGDDTILRLLVQIFENEGFKVIGSQEILPSLLPPLGVLTENHPSAQDNIDIVRARDILIKLGDADVGQASVVSNGLCFGLETIQGTEKMLEFVRSNSDLNVWSSVSKSGVFVKNIKIKQSRLIDFPVIGPDTIKQVSDAKLNGIAIFYNNVFILDINRTIALANKKGIFISVIAE
jgi:hypothetical protein